MLFEGDHNTARPKAFYAKCLTFLHCALRCNELAVVEKPSGCASMSGQHGGSWIALKLDGDEDELELVRDLLACPRVERSWWWLLQRGHPRQVLRGNRQSKQESCNRTCRCHLASALPRAARLSQACRLAVPLPAQLPGLPGSTSALCPAQHTPTPAALSSTLRVCQHAEPSATCRTKAGGGRVEDILVHTEASGDGSAPISPPWSSDQLSMRGSHLHHALSSQSSDFRCSPCALLAAACCCCCCLLPMALWTLCHSKSKGQECVSATCLPVGMPWSSCWSRPAVHVLQEAEGTVPG